MTAQNLKQYLPWRAGVPVWIMAAEGAILALIGLFVVNNLASAAAILLVILGAYLLINGALRLARYFGAALAERDRWDGAIGALGAAAGLLVIVVALFLPPALATAALLFGLALIVYGVLEAVERFLKRRAALTLALFALPVVLIVVGVILIILATSATVDLMTVGQVVAILGIALLALGLIRMYANRKQRASAAAPDEDPAVVASRGVKG